MNEQTARPTWDECKRRMISADVVAAMSLIEVDDCYQVKADAGRWLRYQKDVFFVDGSGTRSAEPRLDWDGWT